MGVTSLKHTCKDRAPEYMPGDPVIVKTGVVGNESGEWWEGEYQGIFVKEAKATRVICFIRLGTRNLDGEDEFTAKNGSPGFVKVPRSRIRKCDGERIDIKECPHCIGYPALTGKCESDPAKCPFEAKKEAA